MPPEPALTRHAKTFYGVLLENAKPQNIEGEVIPVYEGGVTELFRTTKISTSYYAKVMRLLLESGSIRQVQRGAGHTPTIIWLLGLADHLEETLAGLTEPSGTARLLSYIEALAAEVAGLTAWRESLGKELNLAEALRNHELRLTKLEKQRNGGKARNG